MVSRAMAKREAEFLGSEVPDVALPPSPPTNDTSPSKRRRGRPSKNRLPEASPPSASQSPARTIPPTPSTSTAAAVKPMPGRPAVNGKAAPMPAPIAAKPSPIAASKDPRAAAVASESRPASPAVAVAGGEQMSRQTSGSSEGKRRALNGEIAAKLEELEKARVEEEEDMVPGDVLPEEAGSLLSVMESFEAPALLDSEAGDAGKTLRQLLSNDVPIPIAEIESHIRSLPRESGPSQFHTLALSLLRTLRPPPPEPPQDAESGPSTSTPPRTTSPSFKRRKLDQSSVPVATCSKPTYVLHRYLEAPSGGPLGLSGQLGSGTDVFTGPAMDLDDDSLQAAASLKDTDLVALQAPRDELKAFRNSVIDPGLLKDLAPPPAASKREEKTLRKRKGKIDNTVGAGTHVTPLYYSAYSSFAPTYDSELATLTHSATSTAALSRERIRSWRHSSTDTSLPYPGSTPLHPTVPERMGIPFSIALSNIPRSNARAVVDAELLRNANLLRRLQQRQLERLRTSVGIGNGTTHLNAGLRVPPSTAPEVSKEEQAEADSLQTSLARLLQLARPASAEAAIVPPTTTLRRAQHTLVQTRTPVVRGALQLISSRAVREGILTSEPDLAPLYSGAAPPLQQHQQPPQPQQQQARPGMGQQHPSSLTKNATPGPTVMLPKTGPGGAADNSSAIRAHQQSR